MDKHTLVLLAALCVSPAALAASDPQLEKLQGDLAALGYDPGPADGLWGSRTRDALKQFQGDQKLPTTGKGDEQTLDRLRSEVKKRAAVGDKPMPITADAPAAASESEQKNPAIGGNSPPIDATMEAAKPDLPTQAPAHREVSHDSMPARQPKFSGGKTASTPSLFVDERTGIVFVRVPGGCFRMGSDHASDEQPVHEVCVHENADFLIGQYEVTQGEWQAVTGSNPSASKQGDRFPVENVSWNDIQAFIERLNAEGAGHYRLPTEAEWEYAARAGSEGAYSWGDDPPACDRQLRNGANFAAPGCAGATEAVGSYQANPFGLHDVHGNVWEWVEDVYRADAYLHHERNDPAITDGGTHRVFRGGSWLYPADAMRLSNRDHHTPNFNFSHLGFRLIYQPPE